MNYYNPNFYAQYQTYQQPQQQPMPQPIGISGKLVDTVDMVRAADVPLGGYGVFPKADFSEVYIKTWNPNGTTTVATYKPTETKAETPVSDRLTAVESKLAEVLEILKREPEKPVAAARVEF